MSGALTPGTRALVRLSAALAARDAGALEAALEEARTAAEPGAVEEALLQSFLFVGYPVALNGLAAWRRISGRRAGPPEGAAPADWPERGEAVFRRVYGDQAQALRANVRELHPDMETWMVTEYGRVLGRPGLSLGERELCVVAVLAVSDVPTQLYSHLRGALAAGMAPGTVEAALEEAGTLARPEALRSARAAWSRLLERREAAP